MDKHWWMAAGATLAEQDQINNTLIDLETAFRVLLENEGIQPKDPTNAFKWLCEGYTAYQAGSMVRIKGKPWVQGQLDSDIASEFGSVTPKKRNNSKHH